MSAEKIVKSTFTTTAFTFSVLPFLRRWHGPVKQELGVIPLGLENHSKTEHLKFPGGELNVINITEQ